MNKSILINLSPQDIAEIVGSTVQQQFEIFSKQQSDKSFNDEIILPDELCKTLGIDRSTLWRWGQRGIVKVHGIGGRRYYLRSEIMEALKQVKK